VQKQLFQVVIEGRESPWGDRILTVTKEVEGKKWAKVRRSQWQSGRPCHPSVLEQQQEWASRYILDCVHREWGVAGLLTPHLPGDLDEAL
jgi:hypothetical protein